MIEHGRESILTRALRESNSECALRLYIIYGTTESRKSVVMTRRLAKRYNRLNWIITIWHA